MLHAMGAAWATRDAPFPACIELCLWDGICNCRAKSRGRDSLAQPADLAREGGWYEERNEKNAYPRGPRDRTGGSGPAEVQAAPDTSPLRPSHRAGGGGGGRGR